MQSETERLERVAHHRRLTRQRNREAGIPDMELGNSHEPIDYFAQVGFFWLLDRIGGPTEPVQDWSEEGGDERDREQYLAARRRDHERIAEWLRDAEISPKPNGNGCAIGGGYINWPDRVPALKVWAGQMTLAKIAKKLQRALPPPREVTDVISLTAPIKGSSGLDARSAPTALEAGFSLNETGMAVETRIGCELLGIIGLETLPITVYPDRTLGYDADDGYEFRGLGKSKYVFGIEDRSDYYGRFGTARRISE